MQGAIAKEIFTPKTLTKVNAKKTESRFDIISMQLEEVKKDIRRVYCGFNMQVDGDMIDSYIFELMALESKQRFLIRQLKEIY